MTQVPDTDLTLRDVFRVLSRRRGVLFATALLVFLGSIFYSIMSTPRYQATATIQVQKSNTDSLNLGSLVGDASGGATDALSANIDLQTQSNILQSDELALRVIKKDHLEQTEDFKGKSSIRGALLGLISPKGIADQSGKSLEDSPRRRERALGIFHRNLKVSLVSGTRLINVTYSNPDPAVAAAVANDLVAALTEFTFQTKFKATNDVSLWLEGQLDDLRQQAATLQAKVVEVQKSTGLFGVGGSDLQGRPIIYSPVLDKLQQSNSALLQAESNRVLKGAVAQVAKTGNADLISELSGTSMALAAGQGVASSLELIGALRSQEASLAQQVSRDSTIYGPSYPRLVEEKAALAQVKKSLAEETERISVRAANDYSISEKATQGLRARFETDKLEAQKLNDRAIDYVLQSKEAEQAQDLYHDLLKRLREAGILEGLKSSNIAVVNAARVPGKPHSPDIPLYLAIGLLGGLVSGLVAATLADAIDNKVQGPDEIEAQGAMLLGVIPAAVQTGVTPTFLSESKSVYSETMRALRSTLLISRGGNPPKLIMITSGGAGEGKSTISINLALSFAQLNKRVLLLETDLRRPVFRHRLGLSPNEGLATYLSNSSAPIVMSEVEGQTTMKVIPAGHTPPFPAELIGSARMQELLEEWKDQFDFVIIDSPPLLPVADMHPLIEKMDSVVLVVRADKTSRTTLSRSIKLLVAHRISSDRPTVGVVLNGISTRSSAYYGYYGYYGNKRYYSGGEDENATL